MTWSLISSSHDRLLETRVQGVHRLTLIGKVYKPATVVPGSCLVLNHSYDGPQPLNFVCRASVHFFQAAD